MKIVREKINRKGERELVITLAEGEKLMSFKDESFYKLGGQVDEVVAGYVITDSDHVVWCSIEQKWVV